LVQPEQLGYDLAYALALLPLVVAGVIFFLQPAILLFAIAFLAGIVCLLALQLARLSLGLPAWVGFKATHPLVASILIACFCPPSTPAWVAATAAILFIAVDTVLWPQLRGIMLHPALIIFGLIFLVDRQLGIGFINPFDGRHLDEPLLLWYRLQIVIDPVKLYVGNVPGPIGVTSAGAVLAGITYLWYTRKISLGIISGFVIGVAAVALALRTDVGFQVASGPSLFVAGYVAADRRRVLLASRFTFAFGAAIGVITMALRWYGQGLQAAWMAFLVGSLVVTVVLRVHGFFRSRGRASDRSLRTLPIQSGRREPTPVLGPIRTPIPQPVMASAPAATNYRRSVVTPSSRRFEPHNDPNDLVRQMRSAASRNSISVANTPILLGSLVLINPVGLWLTWKTNSMAQATKMMLTGVSVLWYLGVAGLTFALLHR
jgi:electron transport complex protein RnfD